MADDRSDDDMPGGRRGRERGSGGRTRPLSGRGRPDKLIRRVTMTRTHTLTTSDQTCQDPVALSAGHLARAGGGRCRAPGARRDEQLLATSACDTDIGLQWIFFGLGRDQPVN
jgi:hypothetical protein